MALYTFKKDTPVKSACAGDCVTNWPPYHQEKVGVIGDLKASDFASSTREDGKKQGMPLYYFARDAAPGDTKGDGVKEIWSLAKP
jgi:predicted lipoprotein with Yx(FWY)xxD motif